MTALTPNPVLIDGHRIACGVHGDGPPVVLVHGTPSFSLIWRNVVPELTGAGLRIHLFDLLGYGHSERPRDPGIDTSVAGQVDVLRGLLDAWGLDTVHLVAHDIGGAVAQRFALAHPGRLRTLTLIDSVSFDSWPSPRTRQQLQAGIEHLMRTPDAEHRAHFREWLLTTVHDPQRLPEEILDAYVDMISGPVGQASFFQHQVAHYDPGYTQALTPRLAELGARPVRLVWGAEDRWQVPDWAERLRGAIPGAELHLLDDCGHFAMEDRPEAVAGLALEHIRAHDPA
jgi:pimeloyl-ACP methyl ester carboxylesterase